MRVRRPYRQQVGSLSRRRGMLTAFDDKLDHWDDRGLLSIDHDAYPPCPARARIVDMRHSSLLDTACCA